MSNEVSEYILRKKRKKLVKKVSIISIFMIAVLLFILIKASIFNISKIEVKNNIIVQKEKIVDYNSILGNNIFLININDIKNQILTNPYIKSVKIKRKFPNCLVITVEERKATFALNEDNKFYILNEELYIMEEKNNLEGLVLPQVVGFTLDSKFVGERAIKNTSMQEALKEIGDILNKEEKIKITSLDISDIRNITLIKDELKIFLGNAENLQEKMNKVFRILKSKEGKFTKGYIDVSFNEKPVIYNEENNKDSSNNPEGS